MADVVMITGAAGGLGSAVAEHLGRSGSHLVLSDVDGDRLRAVADSLDGAEPPVVGVADVVLLDQIQACVELGVKRWGRIDAVVHAAGGDVGERHTVLEYPEEGWHRCLEMNLTGSFNVVRVAGRVMRHQPSGGHIALVGSGSSLRPGGGNVGYCASKAGLIGLMRTAAKDLGPFGIRVNLIFPGLTLHRGMNVRDDGNGFVPINEAARRVVEQYKNESLLDTLSTPGDFAQNVAGLLASAAISGQIVNFDSMIYF